MGGSNGDSRPNSSLDDILEHHGIKGMKWGVHRSRQQLAAASEDAAKAHESKAKVKSNRGSTDSLSNKELQHLVNRMNLEQQYSRLSGGKNKSVAQKGAKVAADILGNVAKQQVSRVANDYAAKQVAELLKK